MKNVLNANTIPATSNPNGLLRQKLCQYLKQGSTLNGLR